jgi:hypothetical protein
MLLTIAHIVTLWQRLIVGKDVLGKAGDRVMLSDEGRQWCQQHYPDWYSDCVGTITRVIPFRTLFTSRPSDMCGDLGRYCGREDRAGSLREFPGNAG